MEFVAAIASAADLPMISDSTSSGGLRIGSGICSSAAAMCVVIRFPTPGTGLREAMGVVVKNGCAKRYTSVVFFLVLFAVCLAIVFAFVFVAGFTALFAGRAIFLFVRAVSC